MFNVNETEERILKFWEDNDVFRESMRQRLDQGAKPFVFYEGPPTANAGPAIHHFIGRVFKDIVPRYQTMRGRYVLRKGGWDTQGLPVELQVEKELGFKNKKDIEVYGVAAFNAKCRESVWKYKSEWERFTKRIGYWIDLEHPYITYENSYIESLWNIIAKFWERKLLYQAHRVVPFCTRCGTPLSSHEVAQGYKTVTDASVYLKFRVTESGMDLPRDTFILAWTTTPWTLPGNVALAVGADVRYVLAKNGAEHFIVAADLANAVLGPAQAVERGFTGAELVGTSYEPLFSVPTLKNPKSYKVYAADFVSTTDGTGVVHTAVMYGEDDYQLGTRIGLPMIHTVTEQGTFVGVGEGLDGLYVKASETEKIILDYLAARRSLFSASSYEHEYPFCWRCDTPLIYYAKDSWFVRMSAVNKQILVNNATVNWIPAHIRDGRFGQWLREGKDWAFSRERYWGTPLPIWKSEDGKRQLVVSSLDDLDTYRAKKANTYWLIRHGESDKNVSGIIDGGRGKSDLTALGREQVAQTAKLLRRELGRIKPVIVASPLMRTKETADIISLELGVSAATDKRLEEIQLGQSLDGCHDAKYHEEYPTYESKFHNRPPGGESLNDVRARLWGLVCELDEKYEGKSILLVGHEYPLWMFRDVAEGWTIERSITEKEKRGADFMAFAQAEQVTVRNLPRDEHGNVDLHRPYIDSIVLKKDGELLHRIPELCDVWFDSGAMPYAQWHLPFEHRELFAEQFPADFIAEGIDQTRGWFYTLMAVATALGYGAPYRNVLSYGLVLDEKGKKMSKSRGNIVRPDDVISAVGVDAARWYFCTVNNPADPKMFSMKDVRERLTGFIGTLQNCVRFWELHANLPEAQNFCHGQTPMHQLDMWIMSRLQRLISETTGRLDVYDMTGAARGIERFVVDDLSQWWLRRSRKRAGSLGLLRHVLLEVDKLLAPFIPFTSEDMHLRLHAGTAPKTPSVHLHDWPTADNSAIDDELEAMMAQVRDHITAGLAVRKDAGIRVRQPLSSVTLPCEKLHDDLERLIRDELNVMEVRYGQGEVTLDIAIGAELRAEGFAREVIRMIQDMRKEVDMTIGDKAYGQWHSDDKEVSDALIAHTDTIARETCLSVFVRQPDDKTLTIEKNTNLVPGKSIWLGIRK